MKQRPARGQILLVLRPVVLQEAPAAMIALAGFDDVVQSDSDADLSGRYDVAVICGPLPAGVKAGVVITLPDQFGSAGVGLVETTAGVPFEHPIHCSADVVALLDELLPAAASRLEALPL